MAAGSEQPTWKWADSVRNCDTCGKTLRIKDVGLFATRGKDRFIRCHDCVIAKRDEFVAKTRREMGMVAL